MRPRRPPGQHRAKAAHAPGARMAFGERQHILDGEHRRSGQRVKAGERLPTRQMPPQVVGGAGDRRDAQSGGEGDLVARQGLVTHDKTALGPDAGCDHLDGDVVVHPLRAVQCRGRNPGGHPASARPKPRRNGPILQRRVLGPGQIHVAEDSAMPPTQLVVGQ